MTPHFEIADTSSQSEQEELRQSLLRRIPISIRIHRTNQIIRANQPIERRDHPPDALLSTLRQHFGFIHAADPFHVSHAERK